jgi:hypothetical protein
MSCGEIEVKFTGSVGLVQKSLDKREICSFSICLCGVRGKGLIVYAL